MDFYFLNADQVSVSDDGVASGATAFGKLLAEGTTLPDLEHTTEAFMSGHNVATGASASYVIRVAPTETGFDTVLADLKDARFDGSDRYIHFTNRGGTRRFNLGPVKVTGADERPPTGTAARGAALVAFNVAGDSPEDFYSTDDLVTT